MNGDGILCSMGENILITGGSGFIGYHLNRVLDSSKIINLDLITPKFKTDAKYLWGDVCNTSDVLKASAGCNAIIHLFQCLKVNPLPVLYFIDLCRVNIEGPLFKN